MCHCGSYDSFATGRGAGGVRDSHAHPRPPTTRALITCVTPCFLSSLLKKAEMKLACISRFRLALQSQLKVPPRRGVTSLCCPIPEGYEVVKPARSGLVASHNLGFMPRSPHKPQIPPPVPSPEGPTMIHLLGPANECVQDLSGAWSHPPTEAR